MRLSISVIIPTYNRAGYLSQAIDCLLAQTRIPNEIIVVDDGSTDHTPDVLDRYGSTVEVIVQPDRMGPSAARNIGLKRASGDLIAFLDSDDFLPVTSIERRASILEANADVAAAYGGALMIDLTGKNLGWFRPPPFPRGMIFHELAARPVFPIHSVMFRRKCLDAIGYFDESLRLHEDFHFWARFGSVYSFEAIDEVLAYYRIHPETTIITKANVLVSEGIGVRERLFALPAFDRLSQQRKSRLFSVHGTDHVLSGKRIEAWRWYLRAIRTSPGSIRPYGLMLLSLIGPRAFSFVATTRHRLIHRANVSYP